MNIATKEAIIEAVKEGLRVVFLSVLPIVMSGINDKTGAINIQWNVVGAVALLTLLRFIDKLMYELGRYKGFRQR